MINQISEKIYEHVIKKQGLSIFYQPIISMVKEKIIGCEALARADYQGEAISAEGLFGYVRKQHREHELDFLCREESLKGYTKINKDVMLFINFEMSLLNDYIDNLECFIKALRQLEADRGKIVIEINERRTGDKRVLGKFVNCFREQGFLIALDDVGIGHSNLNRIILTKPDIIKIDRNVIKDIQNNYYKCEIVRSITYLASRIGAVVIAEGVEEQEEILACLSLGITLFQGYYFSKAVDQIEFDQLDYNQAIRHLSHQFRLQAENQIFEKLTRGYSRKFVLQQLSKLLMNSCREDYESVVSDFLDTFNEIECIYIIDSIGRQITNTLFHFNAEFKSTYLFSPAKINDYHILKPYYYVAMQKKSEIYISDRYISAATGHFCETYSGIFYSIDKEELLLCIDFPVSE